MKKPVLIPIFFFVFLSCQNTSNLEKQVTADLIGMLNNKAEVKELSIKQVSETDSQVQTVIFDCTLNFTDDLYKKNGILSFKKGMRVSVPDNLFLYRSNGASLSLIKLEFGEHGIISQE